MKSTTSVYYVEVLEDKIAMRVPHTGKKHTEFIFRGAAEKFLQQLVYNNPSTKFRICKRTTTETEGPWLSKSK